MKTIAVLTDLSEVAEHAALYALHVAKKIRANVILYNVGALVANRQLVTASLSGYAVDDDLDTCSQRNEGLLLLAHKLGYDMQRWSAPGTVLPEISFENAGTELEDAMTSIVSRDDITLIVTVPSINDDIAAYIQSDDCRRVLDWSNVPVLVVPESAEIRNPEKVGFVNETGSTGTNNINTFLDLFQSFSPEILVTCFNDKHVSDEEFLLAENTLLANIRDEVDYGRIYYRNIPEAKQANWQWLRDHKKCDMMIMMQQPQHLLKEFFKRGMASEIGGHIPVPVLIFPSVI